jgi:hypothetical protein
MTGRGVIGGMIVISLLSMATMDASWARGGGGRGGRMSGGSERGAGAAMRSDHGVIAGRPQPIRNTIHPIVVAKPGAGKTGADGTHHARNGKAAAASVAAPSTPPSKAELSSGMSGKTDAIPVSSGDTASAITHSAGVSQSIATAAAKPEIRAVVAEIREPPHAPSGSLPSPFVRIGGAGALDWHDIPHDVGHAFADVYHAATGAVGSAASTAYRLVGGGY